MSGAWERAVHTALPHQRAAGRSATSTLYGPPLIAALLFGGLVFWRWPLPVVVDDGAIVLRYLDNAARGAFYSYNPADGPIFGVSSFSYALLAQAIAATRLISPDQSALLADLIGTVLLVFALLLLLRSVARSFLAALPAALFVLLTSVAIPLYFRQALETPLLLAAVCWAAWAALYGSGRSFWLAVCALVLTKVDSAPIVVGLVPVWIWRTFPQRPTRSAALAAIGTALRWGVAPLALWLVFTTLVFGSPLPHSAAAKLLQARPPQTSWFPFLTAWLAQPVTGWLMAAALPLWLGLLWTALRARRLNALLPALVWLPLLAGYLVVYYLYNPPELHPWYFTVPELLLRLQLAVPLLWLMAQRRPWAIGTSAAIFALVSALAYPSVANEINHQIGAIWRVESERVAIGQYIATTSAPTDRLLTAHGHIARDSQRYAIDYSGLNSRVALAYRLNLDAMIRDLKPEWVVQHGLMAADTQRGGGYQLVRSFYGIADYLAPSWRVYRRMGGGPIALPVDPGTVSGAEYLGRPIAADDNAAQRLLLRKFRGGALQFPIAAPLSRRVVVGVQRLGQPVSIQVTQLDEAGAVLANQPVLVPARRGADPLAYEAEIDVQLHASVQTVQISASAPLIWIDPIVLVE